MARAKKDKVDYFPHYVTSGKTLYVLEQCWGNDGYAFWYKLLEVLGNTKGHYLIASNTQDWLFLLAKTRTTEDKAMQMLSTLSTLEAIDYELWQKKIIWSQNFVDNIADVYSKRQQEIPSKPDFCDRNDTSSVISGASCGISTQSKVKESKVNKSKVNNNKEKDEDVVVVSEIGDKESNIFYQFESLGFGVLSPYFQGELEELEKTYSAAWVIEAMQKSVEQGFYKLSYAKGILSNWKAKGKDTPKPAYSKGKEVKTDFTERVYDTKTLEEQLTGRRY